MYIFVDEILEEGLVHNSEPTVLAQGNPPSYPFVFLLKSVPEHFSDHVDELLRIVHLNIAEEVSQEVEDRH